MSDELQPTDRSTIDLIECNNVAEFLTALLPTSEHFHTSEPNEWIFRGHADSTYKLIPTLFRPNNTQHVKTETGWKPLNSLSDADKINAEIKAIQDFFHLADIAGLPLPEDSLIFRDNMKTFNDASIYSLATRSLIGLVQHYGLPTPLLDWTRSPYIAAYFAALAAKETSTPTKISVWALNITDIEQYIDDAPPKVRVVIPPTASNPNLYAQKGVFTFYNMNMNPTQPLDEVVPERLKHFTLLGSEAGKLLFNLAKMNISAATMFPGYAGVVKGLKEEEYWRRTS